MMSVSNSKPDGWQKRPLTGDNRVWSHCDPDPDERQFYLEQGYELRPLFASAVTPDVAMLGAAIAVYNDVWDHSGPIDAGNVVSVRERAMRAALVAASVSDQGAVRSSLKKLIDYADWQIGTGEHHPTLESAVVEAKDALAGRVEHTDVDPKGFDPRCSVLAETIMAAARVHTHDHTTALAIARMAVKWIAAARTAGVDVLTPYEKTAS
jgi:hypothetical protein